MSDWFAWLGAWGFEIAAGAIVVGLFLFVVGFVGWRINRRHGLTRQTFGEWLRFDFLG